MSNTETKEASVRLKQSKTSDVDMTTGSISRHLIVFSLPLLLGNLFQYFYNTVDTWVLGNYVGKVSFAAVGIVGPIFNLIVSTFTGFANGSGVVVSQLYGAGDREKLKRAVHTSFSISLICCVLFTAAGLLSLDVLLGWAKVNEEMYPEAKTYLSIIFSFVSFQIIYNTGACTLRAVGDSKRPFIFLMISALTNIALDLYFAIVLRLGVAGVAYATIIAQGISAALILIAMFTADSSVRLSLRDMCLDRALAAQIIKTSIPMALRMALVSVSNIFVSGYINYFGTDTAGGYTAYHKLEQIVFMPLNTISIAVTTFVGQNLGAGNVSRMKKGVKVGTVMCAGLFLFFGGTLFIAAPYIVAFLNDSPEVIAVGTMLIRSITPFHVFQVANQNFTGALNGSGDTITPAVVSIVCMVGVRQLYLFIVTNYIANTLNAVVLGYPIGWIFSAIIMGVRYFRTDFSKKSLFREA